MSGAGPLRVRSARPNAGTGRSVAASLGRLGFDVVTVPVCVVGGVGWLYALREQRWFQTGPSLKDALPLLQLAQFDAQPLLRVVIAWGLAGLVAGALIARHDRPVRALGAGTAALALLLLAAQASDALTRNLRFWSVAFSHDPGSGVWVAASAFALAAALAPPRRTTRDGTPRPGILLRPLGGR